MCIALNRSYLCRGRTVCAVFCIGQLASMHDIDRAREYRNCPDFVLTCRRAKKVKALEVATDGKMLKMQFQPTCGGVRVFQFNGSINNSNSRINSPTKGQCVCVATRDSRDTQLSRRRNAPTEGKNWSTNAWLDLATFLPLRSDLKIQTVDIKNTS